MSEDPRIQAITPTAAALVCAVADHDPGAVRDALVDLDQKDLYALAVLLAANVAETSPLANRPHISASSDAIIRGIIFDAADTFQIPVDVLLSTDRRRATNEARHVAMAACRLAGLTSVAIGEAFDRDHSTVLHAATRVGEDGRLQRIARRIAAPYITQPGLLGDELEGVA